MFSCWHSKLMSNEYPAKLFKKKIKVFCELGTFVILCIRDISYVFSIKEKSVITNEFTICNTSVKLDIMLETQDVNYDIKITGFSY